jgi:ABC-type Fe3+ transport system substrate-binding protein
MQQAQFQVLELKTKTKNSRKERRWLLSPQKTLWDSNTNPVQNFNPPHKPTTQVASQEALMAHN